MVLGFWIEAWSDGMRSVMAKVLFLVWGVLWAWCARALSADGIAAVRGVIARYAGEAVAESLVLEGIDGVEGRAVYEIDQHGRTLRGCSAVALCKAFYTKVQSKGAGMVTWSGSRFDATAAFQPSEPVRVVAPYQHYQYFNVVTYGYTMAYWNEARWMQEIDWMALHGIDMPLVLIANEAIAERVWRRLGLSEEEISTSFVGPAHLPWMRMGNLSERPDGPQSKAWCERSVKLQHAVLAQMRRLGMKPIVQGFAGFVPAALGQLAEALFVSMDAVLTEHPTLNLARWIGFAREAAEGEPALADYYETNARRLITIWGPPVNDYAAKLWGGLIGSYYWQRHWRAWRAPETVEAYELAWVEKRLPIHLEGAAPYPTPQALMDAATTFLKENGVLP